MFKNFLLFIVSCLFCSNLYPWSRNISSPLVICDIGEVQNQVQLVKTADGNFIILWVDERRGIFPGFSWKYRDIYGQKINANGEIQWQEDGIPIVVGSSDELLFERQTDVRATSDGGSGVIFSWTDASGGGNQNDRVRINRIDGNGNKLWGPRGTVLQSGDSGCNASICSDQEQGAFVIWQYGSFRLYYPRAKAARIGPNGNWITFYGSISSLGGADGEGSSVEYPVVKTSFTLSGEAIAGWEDDRNGPYHGWRALRVQKLSGGLHWGAGGLRVSLPNDNINNIVSYCDIVSDGSGGLIAFWVDSRNGNPDIFAQRVDSVGHLLWTNEGVCICNASGEQRNLMAVSDNAGGAVIVWVDRRNNIDQIFVQRIGPDGSILWQENGVLIGNGTMPQIINSMDGNYFVFWKSSNNTLYAQKIDNSGIRWWKEGGVQVNNSNFDEFKLAVDNDGVIVVWSNGNVYAQKLFNNGTVDPDFPLTITTEKNLSPAALEKFYTASLAAIGGNGNRYTWQIIKGSLPQGMAFDGSTGTIFGTPTQPGKFNFVVSVTDGTSVETKLLGLFVQIDTGLEISSEEEWPGLVKGSSYLLVTRKSGTPNSSICCQFFDDNGFKIGDKFTVYENVLVGGPTVAYNPVNDKYLIVFRGGTNPSSDYRLYGIFIDGQTHQAQQPFVIHNQPYTYPGIAVNTTNGDYLVVACEYQSGGKWIGIMLDKDGQVKNEFIIGQKSNDYPRNCSIDYNPSENNFLVTYGYNSIKSIWGRIIGSDGSVGNEKTLASPGGTSVIYHHKIVYNPQINKYLLAYSTTRVRAIFIDSTGTTSGDEFYVSKTDLQEGRGNLAVSLSGKICAFWAESIDEQGNYNSNNSYIYAQKIDQTGPAYENDEMITPLSGLNKYPVAVAGNTDNNFLLMWKKWEGSLYKVYGIFYNLPQATGDINGDETIDISDVILCLRQAIGLDQQNKQFADMNDDGEIDISDVILILRKAIGLD